MRASEICFPVLLLLAGSRGLGAQDVPLDLPPDFSQESIRARAQETAKAWANWNQSVAGLEVRAFQLPMAEARLLIQKALGAYLDFLDSRRAYSQAVAAHIEKLRAMAKPSEPIVAESVVYPNQVVTLGVNLNAMQAKFDALRDSDEWVSMRRSVRAERDEASKLQDLRRSRISGDVSFDASAPAPVMSSILYRDSERQMADTLQKLWTRYYQTLIDSVEQRPGGPVPLVAIRASGAGTVPPRADSNAASGQNPLVGVWTYAEGSQEFNGVAEPRQVVLEIWIENGELLGRYRALLPDYSGDRKVDLRLRAATVSGKASLTLDFQSKDGKARGQIVIDRAEAGGAELMLVRVVGDKSPVPRGRELLHRR